MLPRLFGLGDPAAYLDATGRAARVAVDTAYDRAGVHPDTPSTHLADAVGAVDFSQPTGSLDDALAEVAELYAHQTTAYHHPRYAAHLNCPVLLSSTAADTVLGALNTAVESWDQARSAALMEQRLLAEVGRWCGFAAGDGVFTSGGSASNLQAMTLARGRAVQRLTGHAGLADLPAEVLGSLRVFVSAATHYSIAKAAGLLGLGRHAVVVVPTDAAGRLAAGARSFQRPFGGGARRPHLGHQSDPAVVVAKLDPGLDPAVGQRGEQDLAAGAQRQRGTAHQAPPALSKECLKSA